MLYKLLLQFQSPEQTLITAAWSYTDRELRAGLASPAKLVADRVRLMTAQICQKVSRPLPERPVGRIVNYNLSPGQFMVVLNLYVDPDVVGMVIEEVSRHGVDAGLANVRRTGITIYQEEKKHGKSKSSER